MIPRSFYAEMQKLSFDPEAASRVLRLAKAKTLGKSVDRAIHREGFPGIAGLSSKASLKNDRKRVGRFAGSLTNPDVRSVIAAQAEGTRSVPGVVGAALKRNPKGTFIRGGDATTLMRQHVPSRVTNAVGPLSPEHRKMVNAITAGHELDEMGGRHSGFAMTHVGHRSPAVILREHNRVATLPSEHAPVRAFLQGVRNQGAAAEGAILKAHGVEYGAPGTRLSRHKIKALSEQMNASAEQQARASLNDIR